MAAHDSNLKLFGFRAEEELIKLVDKVSDDMGLGKRARSAFIRIAVKEKLARMSYLTEDVKKALGIVISVEP